MMYNIKKTGSNTQTVITVALLPMAQTALADGFSGDVSSMAISVRTAIYTLVGVVATIALIWQAAQGFGGRKTWGDVLETCLWIVFAGAAIAIGTWLFSKGGSMKVG